MGYRNAATGTWIPGAERDADGQYYEERAERKRIAKAALAPTPQRPIEEAAGSETDPRRKAARQMFALTRDHEDAQDISEALALGREDLGHDDEADDPSDLNASMIDALAVDVDDRVEEIQGRDADDSEEEDDTEQYDAWLQETHGVTVEDLTARLEELDEEDGEALLEELEAEYEGDLAEAEDAEGEDWEDGDEAGDYAEAGDGAAWE